jgi:hypothetical protein
MRRSLGLIATLAALCFKGGNGADQRSSGLVS